MTAAAWLRAFVIAGIGVVLLVWLHPASADFSVAGRGWNGLREAAAELEAVPLTAPGQYSELEAPGTLIVVPSVKPGSAIVERIAAFVRDGGTLLLLDDYGHGNALLDALGAPVRLSTEPLLDPLYCDANETMPVASVDAGDGWGLTLALNHASWLEVDGDATVWATSSYFSFGDANGNGRWDEGEPQGPLPVGAQWRCGWGSVVVVSDASLLINAMLERGDNVEAVSAFIHPAVYIDQVLHAADTSLDRSKQRLERLRAVAADPAIVAVVVVLLLGAALGYGWRRRREG